MLGNILGNLIGKIVGEDAGKSAIAYFDNKQKLKQELALAKLQGKIAVQNARNALAAQKEQHEAEWSQAMIANSGWKDEYVLVILSIPLVLVFTPWTQPAILQGFAALDTTPEWYRWLLVTIMAAVYGIKPVVNIWKKRTNAQDTE